MLHCMLYENLALSKFECWDGSTVYVLINQFRLGLSPFHPLQAGTPYTSNSDTMEMARLTLRRNMNG